MRFAWQKKTDPVMLWRVFEGFTVHASSRFEALVFAQTHRVIQTPLRRDVFVILIIRNQCC
jgi:hypothetical protein